MTFVATRRVVLVTRRSEFQRLLERHATLAQARFFLETRGQSIDAVQRSHEALEAALAQASAAIPLEWRRATVERADLDRFLFEPDDVIVVVGQDGLVANVAKYLHEQPVIGLNPDPGHNPGILVPHDPAAAADLLLDVHSGRERIQRRTMVRADLDDQQHIVALNELFIGHRSHQSARYEIHWRDRAERQSSSGLIVTTGTGGTGWARSIHRERASNVPLPKPAEEALAFFVREAWPSIATGTTCTEGQILPDDTLEIISRMEEGGVVFGDGIESDAIQLSWGARLRVRLGRRHLHLVA